MRNFIIPSIDLLNGSVVRLYKGDYDKKTIYNIEIDELLHKYKDFDNLHVVDLNGAKGDYSQNIDIIIAIRDKFKGVIQVGGGIRNIEIADNMLNKIGINKIVLGTISVNNIDLTKEIITKFTKDSVVLAIDCKKNDDGKFIPKTNGWTGSIDKDLFEILSIYEGIAKYILCTDIEVDGTMLGPNFDLYRKIKEKFPNFTLQASGGVSSMEDVNKLKNITDFAIVGKVLYGDLLNSANLLI